MTLRSRFAPRPVRNWIKLMTWAAAFCLTIVGCGGGGGGGDGGGGGGATSLTYSGVSTPAVVTATNADSIAAGALNAGSSATGFTGIAALNDPNQLADQPARLFAADFSKVVGATVGKIDFQAGLERNITAALKHDSDTMPGACGGSFSYDIQVDTVSGAFSGSLTFHGYCEDGMVLNGGTRFSGIINPNTAELVSFKLNFDYITATNGSGSVTMTGQIQLSQSGSTLMATMDMLIRDDNMNRVCKIENYQMTIADMYNYEEIEISGRFYDPDYGYVDLQTISPLLVYNYDDYPSSGQLVLTGETGTAGGPTSARLTALDADTCRVEADTDGDGGYDYDSGPIPWTDLL